MFLTKVGGWAGTNHLEELGRLQKDAALPLYLSGCPSRSSFQSLTCSVRAPFCMPLPYRLSFAVCSSSLVGRHAGPWITHVPRPVRSRAEQLLVSGRRRREAVKRERKQKASRRAGEGIDEEGVARGGESR